MTRVEPAGVRTDDDLVLVAASTSCWIQADVDVVTAVVGAPVAAADAIEADVGAALGRIEQVLEARIDADPLATLEPRALGGRELRVDPHEADLVLRATERASASMTESAVGPEVMWLAMAEPVSCATRQAASRTLRSVSRHAGVVLGELDEAGRDAGVGDALGELRAHEVGDLLDRGAVAPSRA